MLGPESSLPWVALAVKSCCYSQGCFHYLPHLSVRSLISTSIFYSVAMMAACLRDWTTKRGSRNEVREDTACPAMYKILQMELSFLLCQPLIKTDMFSEAWECTVCTRLVLIRLLPWLVQSSLFEHIISCTLIWSRVATMVKRCIPQHDPTTH